ncbi:MAG: AmmeMemoRadiSam system protein B [Deltaproteobacteria bacterium]|nr:AmmeMemoRadiSam system protein B [Deltaproteobacteria bacterium]MBW1818723.1 AmmeMemoRadiSam system protein B [Deltaproteobacteria bacterium]
MTWLKPFRAFLFMCACCSLVAGKAGAADTQSGDIRPAILAGSWYAASAETLTRNIRGYLEGADTPSLDGDLKGIVTPHAGHIYSGHVAAHAYRLLETRSFKRVVMIGPSHRVRFRGASVNLQSGYRTPLGVVPVDLDAARKIAGASPEIQWVPKAHAAEHSLEIQLPFLQTVLKQFQIVPILMGRQDMATCAALSDALVKILGKSSDTLILASTDLSHFHTSKEAKVLDTRFAERVRNFDPHGLARDLGAGVCEACGGGPVITMLLTVKQMGADRIRILDYADSGAVTGDHRRVVGYLSAAAFKKRGPQ